MIVDELDLDNLKNVPTDLSKITNVLNNNSAKKIQYEKLFIKVNATDTNNLF